MPGVEIVISRPVQSFWYLPMTCDFMRSQLFSSEQITGMIRVMNTKKSRILNVVLGLLLSFLAEIAAATDYETFVRNHFSNCHGHAKWKNSSWEHHGIAGVYNFETDRVEWKNSSWEHHGIAGVYNFATGRVKWKNSSWEYHGIAGVYNFSTGRVEWKNSSWEHHGIAGVYNFETDRVEWKNSSWENHGIAGVYNFETDRVEWKNSSWEHHGIAGVFACRN